MASRLHDLKKFPDDFIFLCELKSYLKEFLTSNSLDQSDDVLKTGLFSKIGGNRDIRIVLPQGCNIFQDISLDNNLFFVGFIGFAKAPEQISQNLRDKIWSLDSKLMNEFGNHTDILAYVTAEMDRGKDWGNLVILKSLEAVEQWRSSAVHVEAIKEISPQYYNKIRIHRGRIQNGEIGADRTLFLDYNSTSVCRIEKYWN